MPRRTGRAGCLQLDLIDSEIRAHAVAHHNGVRREITELLTDAVVADELHADLDIAATARLVHLTYHGSLIGWALDERTEPVTDTIRADLDAVLSPYRRKRS